MKRIPEDDYKKNYLSEAGYGRNLDSLKILEKSPLGNVPIRTIERRHIDAYLLPGVFGRAIIFKIQVSGVTYFKRIL